jgi:hypothetical protein
LPRLQHPRPHRTRLTGSVRAPHITSIGVSGGTVTIHFTAGASDPAWAFTLLRCGTPNDTYGPATGVITGSAGSYTATVAAAGNIQFYRIRR